MHDRSVFSTATHEELEERTLQFPPDEDLLSNAFLVSGNGMHVYSRNKRLDVETNVLLEDLPITIETGSSWASAPIPGGPTISVDGQKIYCCNNVRVIDTGDNTVIDPGISGYFMSNIALTPDEEKILVSEYSYADGRLEIYQARTFELLATISGLGDFAGEIIFSADGQKAIVGSAGNPQFRGGGVTVIDLPSLTKVSRIPVDLADNVVISDRDEVFGYRHS